MACYSMSINLCLVLQGVSVAVLRGAVLYGLDPSIVHVRRAMKTYGIGIIKPFNKAVHPEGENEGGGRNIITVGYVSSSQASWW